MPTGIAHGTVTLIAAGIPFEATTLRRDVETDGRHATVAFGTDWAEDARRRDFTMNALYADAQGAVHDPLGGISGLRAGRVRFVGDPAQRIREDYLRTLRFFRFSAGYAQGPSTLRASPPRSAKGWACCACRASACAMELLRILMARRAGEAIEIMDETGLLLLLLGGVARRARFERLCADRGRAWPRAQSGAPARGAGGFRGGRRRPACAEAPAFLAGGEGTGGLLRRLPPPCRPPPARPR